MKTFPPVSRIAIVLQNASTGGWRYTCRLIEGLRQARPQCEVTVYIGRAVNKVCERESPVEILTNLSVRVKRVPWLRPIRNRSRLKNVVSIIRRGLCATHYRRWVNELNSFDTVLFAWPFGIECPDCCVPVVFIPHDFNYTHFTGSFVESLASCKALHSQHKRWLELAHPVVSTQFISDELKRTFPDYEQSPTVIRISRLGSYESLSFEQANQIVRELGVTGEYILSLNNLSAHKNLGQVIAGFHYLTRQRPDLKLILAGFGTEGIRGNANTPYYVDCSETGGNVLSLGLRQDREVSALITCSKLVINASLYEAGNGSGLDAWTLGTPVAMSAIPAFMEQLAALDVRAETFNPRCCYEIRDAMLRILHRPEVAKSNAQHSRLAMQRYTWQDVASEYLKCFDELACLSGGDARIRRAG